MSSVSKAKSHRKIDINTKKGKLTISLIAVSCVVVILLAILLPILLCGKDAPFKIPELAVPEEDQYALFKHSYDELNDVKITVRSDTRNVVESNLPRTTPKMLSDDFALVYNKDENKLTPYYGLYSNPTENEEVAQISFNPDNYPAPYKGKGSKTTGVYTQAAAEAGVSEGDYFSYFKYMFMTQGQHLAHEAARRAAETASTSDEVNASFASWLAKHPAADGQYGRVLGENNAVKKEITLDPLYRSYHTTGLYLPAGEPVTVKVEGLKEGEHISIVLGTNNTLAWRGSIPSGGSDEIKLITGGERSENGTVVGGLNYTQVNYSNPTSDYFFKQADLLTAGGKFFDFNQGDSMPFLQSQWKRQNARAPWLSCNFTFTENKTYTIGFAFGGLIQIGMDNCYSNVKTTITGAVETPHYILGITTPEEFEQNLRDAPGVLAVLDTENGILTGPTGEMGTSLYMRQVKKEEIDKLAVLWHSFLSVNESFTGGAYNRHNKIYFDWHVPAGAAVSLGNYTFAQPTGWFNDAMNYQKLLKVGTWGTLHEIGHNHASAYGVTWGFGTPQEGEVRNNALTLLSYILSCDVGTTVRNGGGAEHGGYADPYRTLLEAINNKGKMTDFNEAGYWRALGMYSNIMHSFGAEKFYELLYTYKIQSSYSSDKKADFAYRCSLVYGMNFRSYFNNFYAAKITDEMYSEDQLEFMRALPAYNPVANVYAGGIDGVKTSGDYIVSFGDDITFDLASTTISTLDTLADENKGVEAKKGFKIIGVEKPTHGSIRSAGDGKWIYSFNKGYTGATDEFSFKVKLDDGVVHRLTIYLRINNNTVRSTKYTSIADPGTGGQAMFENFEEQIKTANKEYLPSSVGSKISRYSSSELEVHALDFLWKAPASGKVALSVSGGPMRLYVGESFDKLEGTDLIFSGSIGLNNNFKYFMSVQKDKYYAIRLLTTNRGRLNQNVDASVYLLQKDGQVVCEETLDEDKYQELLTSGAKFAAFPTSQVFHPSYPLGKTAETYVFQPSFLVSKKDNVKLSNSGTDKTQWEVLKAPDSIHQGRFVTETQYIPQVYAEDVKDDQGNVIHKQGDYILDNDGNQIREPYNIEIDKWNYLIDGEEGTMLHTSYQGTYTPVSETNPHEFIIDTKAVQSINFFKVVTRNSSDAFIEKYEFYLATERDDDGVYDWQLIHEGDKSDYIKNVIMLRFEAHQARYLRLVVKQTTSRRYTVTAEIDAGIESPTQKLYSPASSKLFTTKGWQKTTEIPSEPNGYLLTKGKNEKAVIKFVGDSVSLYAATGEDCGKMKVIIDGKQMSEVDLFSHDQDSRKLVFFTDELEEKEHTMEIITTTTDKVMLNVIGLPYSASFLNASNIYLERALTISLVVFVLLFAALLAFFLCLLFIPKFRKRLGGSKAIAALDKKLEENKVKRQQKKANAKQAKSQNVKVEPSKKPEINKTKPGLSAKPAQQTKKTEKPSVKSAAKAEQSAKNSKVSAKEPSTKTPSTQKKRAPKTKAKPSTITKKK